MKKSQASLEMVIGLVILLVVAGVVISLVLHFINPERVPNPSEQLEVRTFLAKCEELCSNEDTIGYCTYYYEGNDWDKDGRKNELIQVGDYDWYACEDRIYCFLVVPCERFSSGKQLIQTCKDLLCQKYIEKYGNANDATDALLDKIIVSTSTTCSDKYQNNIPDKEKWWDQIFGVGC